MAFEFHQACPNTKCNDLQAVYVNEGSIPEMHSGFHYQCPKCKRTVACFPAAFTCNVEIPEGGIVAQRLPIQT